MRPAELLEVSRGIIWPTVTSPLIPLTATVSPEIADPSPLVSPRPSNHRIVLDPCVSVTGATPALGQVKCTDGARAPVQEPMLTSPSVGVRVFGLRSIPVTSEFPGTLISFGLDVEGVIVTVIEAD